MVKRALAATPARPRVTPPSLLTKDEASIFAALVADNAHLVQSDALLIAAYVVAFRKSIMLGRALTDTANWERASRVLVLLATKLRLAPQARIDPQTLGRRVKDMSPPTLNRFLSRA